jgi:hypothetical protein
MDAITGDIRSYIITNAKMFKTSWVQLGQALYAVWKDKLFRDWGYQSFDVYTAKEVGIQKTTAVKLLKNYFFLEQEEPKYVKEEFVQSAQPDAIAQLDSVNVLRMAKMRKELAPKDYDDLKSKILDGGMEVADARKALTAKIKQREHIKPEDARRMEREKVMNRLLNSIKSAKRDGQILKIFSGDIMTTLNDLIKKVEDDIVENMPDEKKPKKREIDDDDADV